SGSYRVQFTSQAGESYDEPIRYNIEVDPDCQVTYEYRPYFKWKKQTYRVVNLPDVESYAGTKVTLDYYATPPPKDRPLEMEFGSETKTIVKGERIASTPGHLRFEFVLNQDGRYRLGYTSEAGETIRDPHSYGIKVLPDRIPQVTLTKPGKDIELPANGVLQVVGMATDD